MLRELHQNIVLHCALICIKLAFAWEIEWGIILQSASKFRIKDAHLALK